MFKELLSTARSNFAAQQREEEIKHLDIDPEEYVMLRDDKSEMAVELLYAIVEKLKIANWEVDEATSRIVRISEAQGTRKNWALAVTSDTRRFHLKVYRDFEGELEEIDLAASRGICAAITFVEKTIQDIREEKIRQVEKRRLAALEVERVRKEEALAKIVEKVEEINQKCRSIYFKEVGASKLGEELLISATDYIAKKVAVMAQAEVVFPAESAVRSKFEGKLFRIIDNVPCKFNELAASITVSNSFIQDCIEGRNLVSPKCMQVTYNDEARELAMNYVHFGEEDCGQVDGLPPRTISGSPEDPMVAIEKILAEVDRLDSSANSDIAKISLLSIELEVSNFNELKKTIDSVLGGIEENVNLIIWNSRNPTK
jgi:hypothetical protein